MQPSQAPATHGVPIHRGRAWHVYPDPAIPGVYAGDTPFGSDQPPSLDRDVRPPDGVVEFWKIGKNTPGIQNDHDGGTYLVLTEGSAPPPLASGWMAEPARLGDDFQLDQRGDRWVRLVRVVGVHESKWGPLQDCEFQIDRT